jgi:hypothetical protein
MLGDEEHTVRNAEFDRSKRVRKMSFGAAPIFVWGGPGNCAKSRGLCRGMICISSQAAWLYRLRSTLREGDFSTFERFWRSASWAVLVSRAGQAGWSPRQPVCIRTYSYSIHVTPNTSSGRGPQNVVVLKRGTTISGGGWGRHGGPASAPPRRVCDAADWSHSTCGGGWRARRPRGRQWPRQSSPARG